MKWITIPEGPLQTNAAAPSIVIFRNISFLSTTKFHIYNQATHAWNKTILSGPATLSLLTVHVFHPSAPHLLPPSANFSLFLKQCLWVLGLTCPLPSSDRPVVKLGNHSKQKKIRKWQILEIDTFLMCFAIAIEAYNTGELKKYCLGYVSPD